jgi:flagellin
MSSVNSVNTNTGAMVALEALNTTNTQLAATQKQISTGYRVNDASDDGAAYAVAQGVRSNVAILTAANNQLGNAQGLLGVTNTALSSATTQMTAIATDLTNMADSSGTTMTAAQYSTKLSTDITQLVSDLNGASYNGQSLIGSFSNGGTVSGTAATSQNVVTDEKGTTFALSPYGSGESGTAAASAQGSLATLIQNLVSVVTAGSSDAAQQALLSSSAGTGATAGAFSALQSSLQNMANVSGAQTNYVTNQQTYNSSKIDSLNSGLGSLVDADLAAESAQLTSLQIKQQLGEQSLSIANQAPSGLISLFRG